MRVLKQDVYGGPEILRMEDVEIGKPGKDQVLVRIEAAGINAADLMAISGKPFFLRLAGGGLLRPAHKVPGSDAAGVIEETGEDVASVQPGDRVVMDLSERGRGAFADRVIVDSAVVVKLPVNVSTREAAAAPMAGVTAFQALMKVAGLRISERILIDGASGGVGSFAVQIAAAIGADITAVCSEEKTATARKLGAGRVISRQNIQELGSEESFDVVYAVNGRLELKEYLDLLKPGGRLVMTGGSGKLTGQVLTRGKSAGKARGVEVSFHSMKPDRNDLENLMKMISSGQIQSFIDRAYPMEEFAQALGRLKDGKAQGKIILEMQAADSSSKGEN